jgi:outer membrane protein OmpA-like peptidoglycan-associated protein
MKWNSFAAIAAVSAVASSACAEQRVPPRSLLDARMDVLRARDGIAMQLDPADVHEADVALEKAEQAWSSSPNDPVTADLASIADRKALLAESRALALKAAQDKQQAISQLETTHASQLQTAQGQLIHARQALGSTQMQLQEQQAAVASQQKRLQALEANLHDTRATIAKIASVKDDDRGMVITLQDEVLFKTGKSDLKPTAMAKLDQIVEALKGKEQPITVYGFTDSVGAIDNNMRLSQMRAESVRSHLIDKGIPRDLLTAQGKGPESPVADNESVEGRAQNRRVEIVVQPKN